MLPDARSLRHWILHLGVATTAACLLLLLVPPALAEPPAASESAAASPSSVTREAATAAALDKRLAAAGQERGAPVLLRIFKASSELELWLAKDGRFERFSSYPICKWRGVLGPKLWEGDRQSPEGFYSFDEEGLRWQGHWFRAFDINYPNAYDRAHGRTGSGILIHGACSSIGCFAMTDLVIDEMFDLVTAAFAAGQERIQVQVFPFRMSSGNLERFGKLGWSEFWGDLKPASDLLDATGIAPRIGVCDGRYVVRPGIVGDTAPDEVSDWCGKLPETGSAAITAQLLDARRAAAEPPLVADDAKSPSQRVVVYADLASRGLIPKPLVEPQAPGKVLAAASLDVLPPVLALLKTVPRAYRCNAALAACRHFMATHAPPAPVRSVASIPKPAKVALSSARRKPK